jgi:hypothetical protein
MWVNRGMPPFDPSRLTPRQKDELIRDLARLVAAQAGRIAALEARLAGSKSAKTPANSSLPPSRGQKPTKPPRPQKPRRKRDGPGVTRTLAADPDRTVDCHARACAHCGTAVPAAGQRLRHAYDHLDLPPLRPVVTRVRIFGRRCPACRRRARGAPPAALPPGSPALRPVDRGAAGLPAPPSCGRLRPAVGVDGRAVRAAADQRGGPSPTRCAGRTVRWTGPGRRSWRGCGAPPSSAATRPGPG